MEKTKQKQFRSELFRLVEGHLRNYPMHKRLLLQYQNGAADAPPFAELPERMESVAWHVAAVEDTLPLLDEEDLQLLEMRYFRFDPLPVGMAAEQLYISRSELYRRRERLVLMFARRFGYAAG